MTFQYPIKRLVLSHSSRSTYKRCERQFEFSKMYGDPVRKQEAFAAGVGKALHAGTQEFLSSGDENKACMALLTNFPYETEFEKYDNVGRGLEACFASLMNMISAVGDRYELVHIKTQLPGNPVKPAIEVPFAFEIVNAPLPIPVYFVGFIDAILKDKVEKTILVNDIKTHRLAADDLSPRYQFDEQTVPYGIVLEHILGRKITEFDVSYLSAYIDLLNPKSQFLPFTKTEESTHDWYKGLCEDIARIGRSYRETWFRRSTDGSVCYSFNKPCWFANECSIRDPAIISRILDTNIRETLFHDDQLPWITAKLEFDKEFA